MFPSIHRCILLCLVVLAPLWLVTSAFAFVLNGYSWPNGTTIVMHLGLSGPPPAFYDGSSSWNDSAADALTLWNQYLQTVQFAAGSTVMNAGGDGINSVFFSSTIYGQSFGSNVLAVTTHWAQGETFTETDVVVNSSDKWASYRGSLQRSAKGTPTYDLHRVLLHEFGHVLGLDHPDEHGQPRIVAIMNSIIGDLDHLADDDIAGAKSLYDIPKLSAPIGSNFSYQVTSINTPTSYSSSDLPPGLSLDSSNGLISGVPDLSGTYTFHVTAFSPAANITFTYQLTVTPSPSTAAQGSFGTQRAKLDLSVAHLVADPLRPRVYASVPSINSIAVIDTTSLQVVKTVFIGSEPQGMAISADGTKLWVANSGSTVSAIGVIDLESLTTLPSLSAPNSPAAVVEGSDGRLYASYGSQWAGIMAIDTKTDTFLGSVENIYGGAILAISPDRNTLFAGDRGLSPSTLYKFDVSTPTARLAQQSDFNRVGENGEDLKISHDGSFLLYANGAGNGAGGPYTTSKIPTSDLNGYDGVFVVGAYPGPTAISNDDSIVYEVADAQGRIDVFDANTFTLLATIPLGSNPNDNGYDAMDLAVDNTGGLLFVATSYNFSTRDLRIFATGRTDSIAVQQAVPLPNRLLNVSTRLHCQTGDDVLIGGFIVSGTTPKKVIMRAIGPSLAVDDKLADPQLELHAADGSVVSNDNWNSNRLAVLASGIAPSDEHEAAIVATLQPGAYTAVLSGVAATTGVALVEIYDLNPDGESRIANISSRGKVDTGDNVMIAGFIVSPDQPTKVIVRAIGPSLADTGVSDALADTTLELHDSDGMLIAQNDDWSSDQPAEVNASGVAPTDLRESAIVRTLQPGSYTAIVRGKDDTTGVALVEVYTLGD